MNIKRLAITGFRNYEWETIVFHEGTNVISGNNAQGKTNLLEAIYLLGCGRSFRTTLSGHLIIGIPNTAQTVTILRRKAPLLVKLPVQLILLFRAISSLLRREDILTRLN